MGNLSHKGKARRALAASGGKDAVAENKNENKGVWYSCVKYVERVVGRKCVS